MAKMTRAEFAERVQAHEVAAQRDPEGYRRRVGLFATLGYAFFLLVLLGTVAGIGLLGYIIYHGLINGALIKLLLVLGIFLFILLRSLWIKFEKPTGIRLTRETAGPLFEV